LSPANAYQREPLHEFYPTASHATIRVSASPHSLAGTDTIATLVISMGHLGTPTDFLLAWLALRK